MASVKWRVARRVCGLAALAIAFTACEGLVRLAPAGATITLLAGASVLPVNGEAEITALVYRGAQATTPSAPNAPAPAPSASSIPVNDRTVIVFSTTIGRVEPAEAETTNGRAVVRLIGDGRSGTATITAVSGPASKTLDVKIGAAGVTRVVLSANPQVLPFGGGSTTITARVEDAQGNGLLGVPVNFSSNQGFLDATVVLSDAGGRATTTLTTSVAAAVTAAVGSGTGQSANLNVTVSPSAHGGN
jgi:hypothetical protein